MDVGNQGATYPVIFQPFVPQFASPIGWSSAKSSLPVLGLWRAGVADLPGGVGQPSLLLCFPHRTAEGSLWVIYRWQGWELEEARGHLLFLLFSFPFVPFACD